MHFRRSRSRIVMVTLASCRMAALQTLEQGGKHCRKLSPGGHLNLARSGLFYLALILLVRIMYIMLYRTKTSSADSGVRSSDALRVLQPRHVPVKRTTSL